VDQELGRDHHQMEVRNHLVCGAHGLFQQPGILPEALECL